MISMRSTQKLMRTTMTRGAANQNRSCLSLPLRAQVSLSTTTTGIAFPSKINFAAFKPNQSSSSRYMSSASASTSVEPVGVDVSLDQLRTSIAGGDYVRLLVKDNPYVDVVQYTHKNVIYNVSHINYHSEAVAIGMTENGLIPGDVVLTFLPPHLCETVRSIRLIMTFLLSSWDTSWDIFGNKNCKEGAKTTDSPFMFILTFCRSHN